VNGWYEWEFGAEILKSNLREAPNTLAHVDEMVGHSLGVLRQ